jgi:hypothetical protein
LQPLRDTLGVSNYLIFGSSHSAGFSMAMCDGSVHMLNYQIDATAYANLGNRADGCVVDAKKAGL